MPASQPLRVESRPRRTSPKTELARERALLRDVLRHWSRAAAARGVGQKAIRTVRVASELGAEDWEYLDLDAPLVAAATFLPGRHDPVRPDVRDATAGAARWHEMKSILASASSFDELRCGAKTRASKPCENHPMKNGRCRMHGGKSAGAPRGNVNRLVHGFYSNRLLPGERELLELAGEATIEDDIAVLRVKLHGLVQASGNSDVADLIESAVAAGQVGEVGSSEIRAAVPQHADLIIRYVDAIRKLLLAMQQIQDPSALDGALET